MRTTCGTALGLAALLAAIPDICFGTESYWFKGREGRAGSFYLIGGNYTLYVSAHRPVTYASDPASRSCFFGGVFQRVSPNAESMQIGTSIPISTIVPYKVGPKTLSLAAGLYTLQVAPMTNCDWAFALNSTGDNAAGVAPVAMGQPSANHQRIIDRAALRDQVQFYAQCRTAKNERVRASGTAQFVHDGTVFLSMPLNLAQDANLGDCFFVNFTFATEHERYLGKNTVRFKVMIGADEFTSTGEFTLTH